MGKYLLKIKPLGPYTLGTDKSFNYQDVNESKMTSYIIDTLAIPNQTSLLGMLRYVLLEDRKLLKSDFNYTEEDKQRIEETIGKESFKFSVNNQSFGCIKKISPLFLINKNNEYLVRTPFFYTNENGNPEMDMSQDCETGNGKINIPSKESYNSKNGYQKSYYNLDRKEIVEEQNIFTFQYRVGNRVSNGKDNEDGFFKTQQVMMNDDYSFALEIECDNFPTRTIGYMGKRRSSFEIESIEKEKWEMIEKVENGFLNKQDWYYALSDIYLEEYPSWNQFCVVEKKLINNIETKLDESDYKKKYKKNIKRYLISSGSVFYKNKPFECKDDHMMNIGYNYLVELGGRK